MLKKERNVIINEASLNQWEQEIKQAIKKVK